MCASVGWVLTACILHFHFLHFVFSLECVSWLAVGKFYGLHLFLLTWRTCALSAWMVGDWASQLTLLVGRKRVSLVSASSVCNQNERRNNSVLWNEFVSPVDGTGSKLFVYADPPPKKHKSYRHKDEQKIALVLFIHLCPPSASASLFEWITEFHSRTAVPDFECRCSSLPFHEISLLHPCCRNPFRNASGFPDYWSVLFIGSLECACQQVELCCHKPTEPFRSASRRKSFRLSVRWLRARLRSATRPFSTGRTRRRPSARRPTMERRLELRPFLLQRPLRLPLPPPLQPQPPEESPMLQVSLLVPW